MNPSSAKVADLLERYVQGETAVSQDLMREVYDDLHAVASRYLSRESAGHTLQATALVHEAYLRLINQRSVEWKGRTHFIAIGAKAMRRILVDHARTKQRQKRGGGRLKMSLDEQLTVSTKNGQDVLAVHQAIDELQRFDERQARIVELRFFGGMTVAEVADVLGVSPGLVEREWRVARAWLRKQLSEDEDR